jgi:hypothetical protein
MVYKQSIKSDELITKVRIIRAVKKDHIPKVQVARSFSCHRNTVRNILRDFGTLSSCDQEFLLNPPASVTRLELHARYDASLLNISRRPQGNRRSATTSQEACVLELFREQKITVGVARMYTHLKRRNDLAITLPSQSQLRGIYRRNNLSVQKTRSKNGERRALYDYQRLGVFEKMHVDVKHIQDAHALPADIYQALGSPGVPSYEWNLIDVRSRFRFIAYSYDICAEFGFRFLLFCIQYIRTALPGYLSHIDIGVDNGSEFCSGSTRKEEEWNQVLSEVNAHLYSYEPNFDIRKNLIERSHLSDDEELYIPRGIHMGTRESFLKEATDYQSYWNQYRPHSGIGMDNHTPSEVMQATGLAGVDALCHFPTVILDHAIDHLHICNRVIEFAAYATAHPEIINKAKTCLKTRRNIEDRFYVPTDAQNVLTYYR